MQTEIDLVTCTEFPIVNRRVLVNMFKLIRLIESQRNFDIFITINKL